MLEIIAAPVCLPFLLLSNDQSHVGA